jgi:hypothetical protein
MSIISKTSLLKESIDRQTVLPTNKVELSGDFPSQNAFIQDPSKFVAAQCSRRGGKTNGLALRFFRTLDKYPKSQCLYIGLTLDSAKDIMWGVLQEINERFNLGCKFTESKLEMKHPNGGRLKLVGADHKNFIKRLRGRKFPGVAIDEAQDMGNHLESLVDDVLTPSISDYPDGWVALTGTPGPVPQGYFFDVTQQGKFGYSVHKWTLLDNPYMPDPEKFISELIIKKEWTADNPTLRREYRNEWVLDTNSLWVQYNEKQCNFNELPSEHKFNYILGVDIGFNDADAIAVLAWSETAKETYLVEEIIQPKQGTTGLMNMIEAAQKKYGAYKIIMDEGGLGKKIAEDLRARFGVPLEAADKAKKQLNVELLNDSMRLGQFKAKKNSRFASDSYLVQIDWDKSTPNRIVIKKKPHSDIIDAVLYAFKASYGYTHKPEPPKPAYGSKAWAKQQEVDMFEQALEHFEKDEETKKYNKWAFGEEN